MRNFWVIGSLSLYFVMVVHPTYSQSFSDLPVLDPSYINNFIEDNQSLAVDCIQNVFQDTQGRLWLQTCGQAYINGLFLVQYDGYRFHPAHGRNLDGKQLTTLGINSLDELFGTYINPGTREIGAFFLDLNTEELTCYPHPKHEKMTLERTSVYLGQVADSTYLLVTLDKSNLYLDQLKNGQFEEVISVKDPEIQARMRRWPYSMLSTQSSESWFLGVSLPLIRYNHNNQKIRKYHLSDFSEPPDPDYLEGQKKSPHPGSMVVSKSGIRYFFYGHKLYQWEETQDHFLAMDGDFPQNWKPIGTFQDKKNTLCFVFSDESDNLHAILQDSTGSRFDYSAFFSDWIFGELTNVVSSDFFKEVYLCGAGKLMFMTVREPGVIRNVLPEQFVSSVMEIPGGNFLVNSVYNGWFEVSGDLQQTRIFGESLGCDPSPFSADQSMVQQIIPDSLGNYWWRKTQYVYSYNPETGVCNTYDMSDSERIDPSLFVLLGDNQIAFTNWANEFYFYDLDKNKEFSLGGTIPTNFSGAVGDMHVDKEGNLWVLTNGGLWKIDLEQKTGTRIGEEYGFQNMSFLSIYEDEGGDFWLGTLLEGLVHFDPRTEKVLQTVTFEQGLAHNSVYTILPDNEGDLWVGTNDGISIVSPTGEILACIYEEDGLKNNRFFRFDAFRSSDGRLFFGNAHGLNVIDPKAVRSLIKRDTKNRKIYLTKLTYSDSNIQKEITQKNQLDQIGKVLLPAQRRNLTIAFSLSSYLETSKNNYAYRLAGIENDWNHLGPQHELNLTNLPVGEYLLQIKGRDFRNNWTEEVLEVPIQAKEVFYKQTWFYLLCALPFILFGLAWAYRNQREKKILEAKVARRTQKIREDKALIESQAQRLAELDQVKSQFFTDISHEFRTPLTVIIGMAKQVQENPEKWLEKGGQMITRNAHNLLNLVNQILDLRKLESGYLPINLVQGDIVQYLRYITESFHSLANTHNVLLQVESNQRSILMDYDPEKFRQILSNLLSNAIKYTPSGGRVSVSINSIQPASTPELQLLVSDNGPGISAQDLPHIFDRFYRASDEVSKAGGTGVGLALTQELVKLLEGSIEVKSEVGEGTTFTVCLPIRREAAVAPALEWEAATVSTTSTPPTISQSTVQLLLIEDNADVVEYMAGLLQDQYSLEFAYNGRIGIEKALESVPDIIISDVMMPEKNGFEVCETLKNDARTSHIPIVLLTAKADVESRIAGFKTGADVYLPKPFQPEELQVVLENLLSIRQKLQEKYSLEQGQMEAVVQQSDEDPQANGLSDVERQFLQKLRTFVEAHLDDPKLSPDSICQHLGMSRSNLYRKLKALTNHSLTHFIRQLRLRKAEDLLQNTELDISEIAYSVGFSDPKYFSRVFAEVYEVSPSEYRKSEWS